MTAVEDPGEYVAAVVDALGRASEDATTLSASFDTAHEMSGGLKASGGALPHGERGVDR